MDLGYPARDIGVSINEEGPGFAIVFFFVFDLGQESRASEAGRESGSGTANSRVPVTAGTRICGYIARQVGAQAVVCARGLRREKAENTAKERKDGRCGTEPTRGVCLVGQRPNTRFLRGSRRDQTSAKFKGPHGTLNTPPLSNSAFWTGATWSTYLSDIVDLALGSLSSAGSNCFS